MARRAGDDQRRSPVSGLLGWQAQFRTEGGGAGFIRLHGHLLSDYGQAIVDAGPCIPAFQEIRLTPESAITVATERLLQADDAAWVVCRGVVIWDLERP